MCLTLVELLAMATEQHRAGRLAEARALYARVLDAEPGHATALLRAGLVELQAGLAHAALPLMSRALAADPADARCRTGLAEVQFAVGAAAHLRGEYGQAIGAYEAAFRLRPDHVGTLSNWGIALQETGQLDAAIERLRAAASLQPAAITHAVNLAIALCRRHDFAAADSVLAEAQAHSPQHPEAAFNRGVALEGLGRLREALAQYQRAASLRPRYAEALNHLGNVHKALGDFTAAASAYAAAIAAQPSSVAALNNAGCLQRTLGHLDEAERLLRRGLEIDPRNPVLHDNLGSVLKDAGALEEALACFRRSLALDPSNAATHSNLVYALSFWSGEAAPILEEARRWNERFAAPLRSRWAPLPAERSPARRLRIGYVSPDFREHCQTLFTQPLLANHDHAAFEVFCYSSVERPDADTRRLARLADVWREVRTLDDDALAAMIRADRIDVLIDLTMHMAGGRPLLFARKPAPVQIAWLAYPGTTGIEAMDFRLSDPRLDPAGFEVHYSERTLRLPDSFWCYDPHADRAEVKALPALAQGHVTFGCLNNPCKLTAATLLLWAQVLRTLPASTLLLMASAGRGREALIERLAAAQIARPRVDFIEFQPRGAYLQAYHGIDIGLDTIPYNGHTTSLDSLWMGVPVVTRIGNTCVGRAGLSQLFHLGLLGLAAATDQAFVGAAVELGRDLPRLSLLRADLRRRMEQSPLMDAARFARNVESLLRSAWQTKGRAAREP